MSTVFETTVDGRNYDVVWEDTVRGPRIVKVLHHNTEAEVKVGVETFNKLQDRLAEDIVLRALKLNLGKVAPL